MPDIEILDSDEDDQKKTACIHVGRLLQDFTVERLHQEIENVLPQIPSIVKILDTKILHDVLSSENLKIGLVLLEINDNFDIDELAFELEKYNISHILNKKLLVNVVLDSSRLGFENVRVISRSVEVKLNLCGDFDIKTLLREDLFDYILGKRFNTMISMNDELLDSRVGFKQIFIFLIL